MELPQPHHSCSAAAPLAELCVGSGPEWAGRAGVGWLLWPWLALQGPVGSGALEVTAPLGVNVQPQAC